MTNRLSSSSFSAAPALKTFLLDGAEETNGQLLFSDNDRWLLCLGDSGRLQVWDLINRHRVLHYVTRFVRGAVFAEQFEGLLAAAEDSLLAFRVNRSEFDAQPIANRLPGLTEPYLPDSANASVLLFASDSTIAYCNPEWLAAIDLETSQVLHHAPLVHHERSKCEQLLLRSYNHDVAVDSIESIQRDGTPEYLYRTVRTSGELLSQLSIQIPGYALVAAPKTHVRPGIVAGASDVATVVIQPAPGSICVYGLTTPFKEGMWFTSSENGKVLAGVTPTEMAFWKGRALIRIFQTGGQPCDVKTSNDGRTAAILYCDEPDAPNVTGILDLATGRQIGFCTGHVIGLAPFAFSKSNRYLATLVTDGTASYHPAGLPSGTVVLTDLTS